VIQLARLGVAHPRRSGEQAGTQVTRGLDGGEGSDCCLCGSRTG
jgi:hypothetical protein